MTGNDAPRRILTFLLVAALLLIGFWFISSFLVSITRIEAGYVGVEVNLAGSQRGASEIPYELDGCSTAR